MLIYCPECYNQVSDKANHCPTCGHPIKTQNKTARIAKHNSNGCLKAFFISLIGVFLVLVIIGFYNGETKDVYGDKNYSPSYSTDDYKVAAYSYAEEAVKKNLKSPSTADFPKMYEDGVEINNIGNGEYRINSWVDSQNGFGAMIRSNFSVIIVFSGNTASYKELNIN